MKKKYYSGLKPCPFCGGKAYLTTDHYDADLDKDVHCIECSICAATLTKYPGTSREELKELWNRRPA